MMILIDTENHLRNSNTSMTSKKTINTLGIKVDFFNMKKWYLQKIPAAKNMVNSERLKSFL